MLRKSNAPGRAQPAEPGGRGAGRRRRLAVLLLCGLLAAGWLARKAAAQIETITGAAPEYVWSNHASVEGHLALHSSPAGAFSPDSSQLAVASRGQVVLMGLEQANILKILHPSVEHVTSFDVESANFLNPTEIFVLARGYVSTGSKRSGPPTPEMGLRWDTEKDTLIGRVNAIGAGGGYQPARFLPYIHYLGLNKQNIFELWNPLTGRAGQVKVAALTRRVGLYTFSPDGRWLVVGRIEGDTRGEPVVISMATRQMVDALGGHGGTALSVSFSRDSSKVVTACADGKVRIYAAPAWKLLETLSGHHGPVHWADFSPDGRWVVSAGEDKTVRVWSAESGKLLATLRESPAPVLTAAFSPNGHFIAASTADHVLVWQRVPAGD